MAVNDQLLGIFPDMIGREFRDGGGGVWRKAALYFVTCGKRRFTFLFSFFLFFRLLIFFI